MLGTDQRQCLRGDAGRPRTDHNSAGGQSFRIQPTARLLRFLVLGSSSPTYYASAARVTDESLDALHELLKSGGGGEALRLIRSVSKGGRAPRQTATLTALAACTLCNDAETRAAAHASLPTVARTPAMLFEYLAIRARLAGGRGWGRAHRRAVAHWYAGQDAPRLASAVTKYRKRHGYSHRDALRLAHAKPPDAAHDVLYAYAARGIHAARAKLTLRAAGDKGVAHGVLARLDAAETAKRLLGHEAHLMVKLIGAHQLTWESVPGPLLSSYPVWEALLTAMPLTAMIRNLAKMTTVGLLRPGAHATELVAARLRDGDWLRRARVHPMAVLLASRTYTTGRGELGKLRWEPVPAIVEALDDAFELSFATVTPAGKRTLLALDVSGSMAAPCRGGAQGAVLTCAEASAAMAVVAMRTEPECTAMCFSHDFEPLGLNKSTPLTEAVGMMSGRVFGATDCSLPMQYAQRGALQVDTFVVYTDSETFHGAIHPCEALCRYREASGIADAKLIVVAMASNGFTIADPRDGGMLDVVGFDAAAPGLIADFSAGRV